MWIKLFNNTFKQKISSISSLKFLQNFQDHVVQIFSNALAIPKIEVSVRHIFVVRHGIFALLTTPDFVVCPLKVLKPKINERRQPKTTNLFVV
mgnify:CR=1 FL=1